MHEQEKPPRHGRRLPSGSGHAVLDVLVPIAHGRLTAGFTVKLRKPTPSEGELEIRARVVESEGDRARIEAEILADGDVTARGSGLSVAVKEGHRLERSSGSPLAKQQRPVSGPHARLP